MGNDNKMLRMLFNRAKISPKRIVFAEADHLDVLKAAQIIFEEGIGIPILLGRKDIILELMKEIDFDDDIEILDPKNYPTEELIYIESIEIAAIKDPVLPDGPCIFTGKAAIYFGKDDFFDDHKGHVLVKNQPLAICDKTAKQLKDLKRNDIHISESTYHYDGGGCC